MASDAHILKVALLHWRFEQATIKFGPVIVRTYGSKLFISDDMLDRLVLCAQNQKVQDVAQIIKETSWKADRAHEFGASLISLLLAHFPLPVIPLPPAIQPAFASGNLTASASSNIVGPLLPRPQRKTATVRTCSKCHQEGHISTYCITAPYFFYLKYHYRRFQPHVSMEIRATAT
jgi:hypothetical protein